MNPVAKEPEPKRGPNVRVKPFGYFGAFAKVTRRQGGTLGGRYRSNGYSPKYQSERRTLLRYIKTKANPRQTIANTREDESSIAGFPSQPKLSINIPIPNCPTITATVATAVPTTGTAPTMTIM